MANSAMQRSPAPPAGDPLALQTALEAKQLATEVKHKNELTQAAVDNHEDNCGERYSEIKQTLRDFKTSLDKHGEDSQASIRRVHERLDTQFRMLMAAMGAGLLLAISTIGVLVVQWVNATRGGTP